MLNIVHTEDLHVHVMFEFLEGLIGFGEETDAHIQGLRPRARVHEFLEGFGEETDAHIATGFN